MLQNGTNFKNTELTIDSGVLRKLKSKKIGYFPHNKSLKQPGDRRRFVFFAKEFDLDFEIADHNKEYDIVFLTSSCNISEWVEYKKKHPNTKIIFELIDSYVLEKPNASRFLKGTSRYLTGKDSKFYLDYNKAFFKIIRIADKVVCSTPLQKKFIETYNKNVSVSLDYFEDEIITTKSNYTINDKIKLVWEGQSYTVENLLIINEALKEVKDHVELHIITDKVIKFPLKVFDIQTDKLLNKLSIDYHFHEWKIDSFCTLSATFDLAIIPLNEHKEIMWNKPENKLLFFWQIGLPTLTSASPAYKRVMDKAGLEMYAIDMNDWVRKIIHFKNLKEEERANSVLRMKEYVNTTHSKQTIIDTWLNIFDI